MSKSKKQTIIGVIMAIVMLVSMGSFSVISYAASNSDSSSFTISGNYEKQKTAAKPNCTLVYKFKFGSATVPDYVSSIATSTDSTSIKAVAKWTSKIGGTTLTKTDTGQKAATAVRKGITGSATKSTYHEFVVKNSKDSYTFIATGNR